MLYVQFSPFNDLLRNVQKDRSKLVGSPPPSPSFFSCRITFLCLECMNVVCFAWLSHSKHKDTRFEQKNIIRQLRRLNIPQIVFLLLHISSNETENLSSAAWMNSFLVQFHRTHKNMPVPLPERNDHRPNDPLWREKKAADPKRDDPTWTKTRKDDTH